MKNDPKFASLTNSKLHAEVTLTPIEGKIQYRVAGKIINTTSQEEVENLKVLDADDPIWNVVFGTPRGTKRFLKANKKVRKVLPLASLGLSDCEMK